MSRLKDLLIEADSFAEEVIHNGCEDFEEFSSEMKKLRHANQNWIIKDDKYLEQAWTELREIDWNKYGPE